MRFKSALTAGCAVILSMLMVAPAWADTQREQFISSLDSQEYVAEVADFRYEKAGFAFGDSTDLTISGCFADPAVESSARVTLSARFARPLGNGEYDPIADLLPSLERVGDDDAATDRLAADTVQAPSEKTDWTVTVKLPSRDEADQAADGLAIQLLCHGRGPDQPTRVLTQPIAPDPDAEPADLPEPEADWELTDDQAAALEGAAEGDSTDAADDPGAMTADASDQPEGAAVPRAGVQPVPTTARCNLASRPAVMPRATNRLGEASGDISADHWAVGGDGHLRFYTGTTSGQLRDGKVVMCDQGQITSITPVPDVNGDHRADLLVRESSGLMYYYYSLGAGFLQKGPQVGINWNDMDSIQYLGNVGSSAEYVIGRKISTGELYRYNLVAGRLTNTTRIGTGWSGMKHILATGQFTGGPQDDLIGIRYDGLMFAYAGYGNGRVTNAGQVGRGWNNFVTAFIPGDVTGNGNRDLFGLRSDGGLFFYSNAGRGGWSGARQDGYFYDDRAPVTLDPSFITFAFSETRERPDILREPQTADGVAITLVNGRHQYQPVSTLWNVHRALDAPEINPNADPQYLAFAKRNLDYLVAGSQATNSGRWFANGFQHSAGSMTLQPPWVSGMAQGMALSAFSRYYALTGDETYARYARETFSTFGRGPGERFWFTLRNTCTSGRGRCVYFEEYPTNYSPHTSHVVNGNIYAIWGLYDYYRVFGDASARDLFLEATTSVRDSFGDYRYPAGPSWYALTDFGHSTWGRPLSYHRGVTYQIGMLAAITGDAALEQQSAILKSDRS